MVHENVKRASKVTRLALEHRLMLCCCACEREYEYERRKIDALPTIGQRFVLKVLDALLKFVIALLSRFSFMS